ncbi:MAG: hypothetical protein ACI31F_00040 [Muribaculaceae bacterium]
MEERKIRVFIAGSTTLKEERNIFKIIASDLNNEFEHMGIVFKIKSYESVGNQQEDYNEFIRNKADLIIFVLNGSIGKTTEEEFRIATDSMHKTGYPKILAFYRTLIGEDTTEKSYLRGILMGCTGQYLSEYETKEDLIEKGKQELRRFVKKHLSEIEEKNAKADEPEEENTPEQTCMAASEQGAETCRATKNRRRYVYVGVAVLFIIAAFLVGIYSHSKVTNSPALVFVGGGSAANYIEQNYKNINLYDYDNGYYIHMPSGNAWLCLTEEVVSDPGEEHRKFYPICLSASRAKNGDFLRNIATPSDFLKKGIVIGKQIGWDTLTIYIESTSSIRFPDETIRMDSLADIIDNQESRNITCFSTSYNSGTWQTYAAKLLEVGCVLDTTKTQLFSEYSSVPQLRKVKGNSFLLLGSKYYSSKNPNITIEGEESVSEVTMRPYYVVDSAGRAMMKPMYIYFMAYHFSYSEDDTYDIPEETMNFLKELNVEVPSSEIKKVDDYTIIKEL